MTPEDRLDSWKEIAAYLNRDVTTVQRWEKREGMPVRRHQHAKLGSVYAFRSELDEWARSRGATGADAADVPAVVADIPAVEPQPATVLAPKRRSMLPWSMAGAAALLAAAAGVWVVRQTDYFWKSPLSGARFHRVTELGGTERAAALSRDGRFLAFISDKDGRPDVWVTQIGTGLFYNLTRGRFQKLANQAVRTLGFSPDGTMVTFWADTSDIPNKTSIGVWAIPVLGGDPRPYLEGTAEFDWTADGTRLVYHTTAAGDPTFVREPDDRGAGRQIFVADAGRHCHFQTWSTDGSFVYVVLGALPDGLDVWRLPAAGGTPERITPHNSRVSHPVLLDDRTLMYLATDRDGSGPWLYTIDVTHRVPHRLDTALDRYTSLSASADGRRLVASLAQPKGTLWRIAVGTGPADAAAATPIALTTSRGVSPRLGPGYMLYVTSTGSGDGVWKLADGTATPLWTAPGARVVGGPEIAADGRVAFSVEERGRTVLYTMNADGTDARARTEALTLSGEPAWAPDGQSITIAAMTGGAPRLHRVALDGRARVEVNDYSLDAAWSPRADFMVYSGPDVGTTLELKAAGGDGRPRRIPALTLPRGARRVRFVDGGRALVVMRGEIEHKDLWRIDLETGEERQLTRLPADFKITDFDVSGDGRDIVVERVQDQSDIVLVDRAR